AGPLPGDPRVARPAWSALGVRLREKQFELARRRKEHGSHLFRERGERGVLEDGREEQLHTQQVAESRDHLDGEQGMSAELEEVVVRADAVDLEQIAPDGGECLL